MKEITKQTLPHVVHASLLGAGCDPAEFPDLAMRILVTRAIDVSETQSTMPSGISPKDVSQWLVLNPTKNSGTRISRNALNPLWVASAVVATAATATTVISCIVAVIAIVGACSAKITNDQAALLIALQHLKDAQQIPSAIAVALKMTTLLKRDVDALEVIHIVAQLKAINVPFTVGPVPHQVVQCHESTTFLENVGA